MFYRNLDQPELDKIQTISVSVYFLTFTYFLCVLRVRFYIKYISDTCIMQI